jgi:hypothetical protein
LLAVGVISCKNSEKETDKLEIAKQYYKILNNSDSSQLEALIADSLLTKESEYDYKQIFSLQEYREWMKWDSVFIPSYKVLQIEQVGDVVKARISKIDKRILFLHEGPIVTNQSILFDKNKISCIETTEYVNFNNVIFVKNRTMLLSWIDENHPDLKGFIYDQTKTGAINYLKAIELFENNNLMFKQKP